MKSNRIKESFDSFLEKKVVPLSQKVIVTIFILVIIVPMVAFYFLYYAGKAKEIDGLKNQAAQLRREITEAKERAAKLDEHLAEMEETKRLFAEASVLLPQKKEIPSLLTNISALGTNSGLNMTTFSPGGERREEFYAVIPVSIRVNGPYHNIGSFLYEVSKLDRIVSAVNFTLGGGKMERGEMMLDSSINLVTYRFLEESEMVAQNAPAGKKRK
jgi:type IV pilus assembly protein PilO